MENKPYFHKLEQKTINKLIEDNVQINFIVENYKQPSWCDYPNALDGKMGCWSLIDLTENGLRTKISKNYCKTCDCCNLK